MTSQPLTPDQAFGLSFRRARERLFTQEQIAEEMQKRGFDFHQATVYKVERGKRKVTIGEALALADLVKVPVEALATDPGSATARSFSARKAAERVYNLMGDLDRVAREGRLAQHLLHDTADDADKASSDDAEISLVERYRPLFLHRIFRDVDDALNDVMSNPKTYELLIELGFVKEDADWQRGGEVEDGER